MYKASPLPTDRAIEIVQAIARGDDPYQAGASLRAVSLVQAETVHAVCIALASLVSSTSAVAGAAELQTPQISDVGQLPPLGELSLDQFIAQIETYEINRSIEAAGNNVTQAARQLGITFRALRYRLETLDEQPVPITMDPATFPPRGELSLENFLFGIERKLIGDVLEEVKFNRTEAARRLGITYRAFRYRLGIIEGSV